MMSEIQVKRYLQSGKCCIRNTTGQKGVPRATASWQRPEVGGMYG